LPLARRSTRIERSPDPIEVRWRDHPGCKDRRVSTVLLCTDGSDLALTALRRGWGVIGSHDRVVVAIVVTLTHAVDVHGTGMAGGVMTPDEAADEDAVRRRDGQQVVDATRQALGLGDAEAAVVDGDPGGALCDLAAALPADVMVIGTRGRGGLRRAMLGSVSDHVVRNAPCPVVVCPPA
jgi:nucleotide-binding universal stress UspA family protein